ncbi:amidophosphoribosyltransferase [Sulfuricurvum sp. IAE1]|uniref:amidophosphoribosyltransferase n=1 Tax=Sulfuricurvum sp. IAE1 TaxID=2546102 RepID=UPI00105241E4|nr:amidophosphoribosyltransferase [Sulfuricurvum sp. IAE1]MDD3769618.1 amidophosphoribosyltransferase [Sulfuricurvum sp.]MDX9965481.1 amidophosphoribosyltransferase [Sulfuricurvum sp.]TDA62711.1 amidophosphoribosyltransferase [Sulfuricurvum sp. IAE1]
MRSLNEKCAVVGIFDHPEASKLAYFSLHALQHRGQEAAGISTGDGEKLYTIKDRGLVTQVFDTQKLNTLKGHMAIGHTRYSTAGDDSILDAQPVFARYDLGEMSIVHNGNLTNAKEVRDALIKKGAIFQTFMDTENLIHLIAKSDQHHLTDRIIDAVKKIEGAYSLVFLSRSKMFAMRDPHGFRPLSLGRVGDGYVVASETCAFDLIGAEYIRDVEPGELLIFEKGKAPQSIKVFEATPKHCIFEYVYFARPDSNVYKQNVYEMRKAMGKELAKEQPSIGADMIVPVPDGGVPAAIGYAQQSGIPFEMAIMRNHYIGRTFIEPTQEMRDLKVKMKLSPIEHLIKGKSLVVIDDSIVRGTTSRQIVRMLKAAGAREVHMRISSPPTTDPCFYGVDTPDKEKLIAANMSIEEICAFIEADSLGYLSNEALLRSVNGKEENYCTACFTGKYII